VALTLCCKKIAEAEAAVSVNKKKWLVMHMHVQLKLDELGPYTVLCVMLLQHVAIFSTAVYVWPATCMHWVAAGHKAPTTLHYHGITRVSRAWPVARRGCWWVFSE
jgi:hypothetical protein